MAVGDYIHAKEADQLPTSAGDVHVSSQRPPRQVPDDQAEIGVSRSRFVGPFIVAGAQQPQEHSHEERQKSIFDTDVEGVDDSTITVTSVADVEDGQPFIPSFYNQRLSRNWNGSPDSDQGRFQDFGNAVATEEDQSRSAGSVDDEDADDEKTQTLDWISSQAYRSAGATPGHQREDPSRSHSRMDSEWIESVNVTSTRFISTSDIKNPAQLSYGNGHRKNVFSQTLATTPQNRFNFKTERPYERLIYQSPTRRASGPRPQPARQKSMTSPQKRGLDYYEERTNRRGGGTLDATDDGSFEDDDSSDSLDIRIQQQRSRTTKSGSPTPKKNRFRLDYPQEVLQRKSFSDLENEPFDFIPAPITPEPSSSPSPEPKQAQSMADKFSHLRTLSEADQRAYLSTLSITEWEEFGDQLIAEFSTMLSKIKDARQARRKTVAVFEAEIKRRHERVQRNDADLDKKLAEMKEGGLGVLRGAVP
jgi:hypothetical protein